MNIIRTFRVAGHLFSLSLPDKEGLWDALKQQYGPFETDGNASHQEELLFSIEVGEVADTEQKTCLYDSPTEDGETVVKLYSCGDSYLFETSPDHRLPTTARILSSADFRHAVLQLESMKKSDVIFSINNAAMLMFAFSSATESTIEMHASVTLNSGRAYLFLGVSGTGKSTHSSLWLKHIEGSELMNDDNPVVRVMADGSVIAYGTPWSGKTPCYKNVSAPVGAFVQLRQDPENKIRRMSILESYASLYGSISGIKNDSSAMADGLNKTISRILGAIPCYHLDCRADREAALLCHETIAVK